MLTSKANRSWFPVCPDSRIARDSLGPDIVLEIGDVPHWREPTSASTLAVAAQKGTAIGAGCGDFLTKGEPIMDRSWFRRRTRWAILWVVAMLMASFAQTAVANEGQAVSTPDQVAQNTDEVRGMPDVAPPKLGEINEAALEDLTTMAEQEGISLEEAIDRYAWHESFSMLVADIREKYPDRFAGAMITPDGNLWIAFESKAPEGVDAGVEEHLRGKSR